MKYWNLMSFNRKSLRNIEYFDLLSQTKRFDQQNAHIVCKRLLQNFQTKNIEFQLNVYESDLPEIITYIKKSKEIISTWWPLLIDFNSIQLGCVNRTWIHNFCSIFMSFEFNACKSDYLHIFYVERFCHFRSTICCCCGSFIHVYLQWCVERTRRSKWWSCIKWQGNKKKMIQRIRVPGKLFGVTKSVALQYIEANM